MSFSAKRADSRVATIQPTVPGVDVEGHVQVVVGPLRRAVELGMSREYTWLGPVATSAAGRSARPADQRPTGHWRRSTGVLDLPAVAAARRGLRLKLTDPLVMNSCMCRHSAAGCSSGMKWPASGMSLVVSCRIPDAWRPCA